LARIISIIGSTGSIGTQALEVARHLKLKAAGLAACSNIDLLEKQAREFNPRIVAVKDARLAEELFDRLKDTGIEVCGGVEGIARVAAVEEADTVVASIVGSAGIMPTLEAIKNGKNVALANKETLVAAGQVVMSEAEKHNVRIIPVDSEHSAIFQCLRGNSLRHVSKIILTASGGPFRRMPPQQLRHVTPEEALRHPNWKMGCKVTVDSATLMNKGLEVIEARWLFGLKPGQIEVLIHPQSVVHSMVEYVDGSVLAQMGASDMKLPIQFALAYPERIENNYPRLDLAAVGNLTFEKPDFEKFPCLRLAYEALETGGTMPAVLNASDEEAVNLFLNGHIKFTDIPRIVESVMGMHSVNTDPCFDDIIRADEWARQTTKNSWRSII